MKRFFILFFLFSVSLGFGEFSRIENLNEKEFSDSNNAEFHLQRGLTYYKKWKNNNKYKALESFKKAEDLGLNKFILYRKLGEVYYYLKKYNDSIRYLNKALKKIPDEYITLCYLELSKSKLVLEDEPENTESRVQLANAYFKKGLYSSSVKEFQRVLEYDANNLDAKQMLEKAQESKEANQLWDEAYKLAKKSEVDKAIKKYLVAIDIFKRAESQYGTATIAGNLANLYKLKGDQKKALKYYKTAMIINKEINSKQSESDNLGSIGIIYYNQANYKLAIKYYKAQLEIVIKIGYKKGESASLGNIGNIYYTKGDYDKAKKFYSKQLNISRMIGYKISESIVLANVANVFYVQGDYKKALKYYLSALKISKDIKYKRGEASSYNYIGNYYYGKGNYQKAIEYYEFALSIYKDLKNVHGQATSYGNMGATFLAQGYYKTALKHYQKKYQIVKKTGHKISTAEALGSIGSVYYNKGDYEKALKYFRMQLKIERNIGHALGESSVLCNIGNLYSDKGDYEKALEAYNKQLKIDKKVGYKRGIATALINIGTVYSDKSEYNKYYKFETEALKIAKQVGYKYGIMVCYENIGLYYRIIGEYSKALSNMKKALKIAKAMGARDRIAEVYGLIANVNIKALKFNSAENNLYNALKIYKELEKDRGISGILVSFSELYLNNYYKSKRSRMSHKALVNLKRALKYEKKINRKPILAKIYYNYARANYNLNKYSKAINYINRSINIINEIGLPAVHWRAYQLKADILNKKGETVNAIEYYKKSINILKKIFGILGDKKKGFMQDKIDVYESLIGLLMDKGRILEAERYLSESKAFLLRLNSGEFKLNTKNKRLNQLYKKLVIKKRELDKLNKKIRNAKNNNQIEILKKKKSILTKEYNQRLLSLKFKMGREGKQVYDKLNLNIKSPVDYRNVLPADAVVIEYALLKDKLYIIWLTKEKHHVEVVPVKRDIITKLISNYRERMLKDAKSGTYAFDSREEYEVKLYNYLIKPISKHIKSKKHLIIMPYGILYYLPFDSLHDNDKKFLIEQYDITYFTRETLSRIKEGKKTIKNKKNTVIAFGNPDGTLSGAEEEVKKIGKVFKNRSKIFIRNKSSLDIFKKDSSNYYIIHLATHGVLGLPASESYIIFGNKKNTFLKLFDIPNMLSEYPNGFINTQMVVLSACSTAIEKKDKKGSVLSDKNQAELSSIPLSLSQAFESLAIYSIVATLWDVDDLATKTIMTSFYKKMKNNNFIIGRSLCSSKRDFIKMSRNGKVDRRYINPYFWSAFVLFGDWR